MRRGQRASLHGTAFAAAAEALPRARTITVRSKDGTLLHTEVFGRPDGYPIVLAHGITCAIRVWAYQIADLAEDYRVIAFDHRGHGRSGVPPQRGNYSLDHLAADLDAVLETTLGPGERAVIAGHSMGGIAITSWAERYPDRVPQRADAVALINTTTGDLLRNVQFIPVPPPLDETRVRAAGTPAPDVRRSAATACRRAAESAFRVDSGGGTRRRSRDRRIRLRPVRIHTAGRSWRLGQDVGRRAGPTAHRAAEPRRTDAGDRQRKGPAATARIIAADRRARCRTSRRSSSCPAATARFSNVRRRSTRSCGRWWSR